MKTAIEIAVVALLRIVEDKNESAHRIAEAALRDIQTLAEAAIETMGEETR